jgi:hypothetical protein
MDEATTASQRSGIQEPDVWQRQGVPLGSRCLKSSFFFASPHVEAIRLYIGTFIMAHKQCTDVYPDQKRMIDEYEDAEQAVMFVDAEEGSATRPNC